MLDQLYDSLDQLPADERRQLLRELLPPQELFARMDGTRFLIRRRGLGMFETRSLLHEAGIPDGDPRQQVFRYLRGGLIDRSIPDQLRAIAARADTVCRQSGAVAVWDAGQRWSAGGGESSAAGGAGGGWGTGCGCCGSDAAGWNDWSRNP
jgi:hypothetical protein